MNLRGKVCIVTGANSGVGKETAAALAADGATLVMACRNAEKSKPVLEEVRARSNSKNVELLLLDLASTESVHQFAEEFRKKYGKLDILINNAGLYKKEREMTRNGMETQFQTNHLGPFLLTNLLLDLLKKSAPARIVNVSSEGHRLGFLHFDNLQGERIWNGWLQYCTTKLENILFTLELAKRIQGTGVTANSLHPGPVNSGFAVGEVPAALHRIAQFFMISPQEGAKTSLYAATSPEMEGVTGRYLAKSRIAKEARKAQNAQAAARLWQISEELSGLKKAAAA
ncbi:MAG: SDR family oxidoreductase [Bdellovibrionota bacterium]